MNLLLLLSALLSALTGAGSAARMPQQAVAVARVAEVAARNSVAVSPNTRPQAASPKLVDVQPMTGAVWTLAPAAPLFLSRRRE